MTRGDKKNNKGRKKKRRVIDIKKVVLILSLMSLLMVMGTSLIDSLKPEPITMQYVEFMEELKKGNVEKVTMYSSLNTFGVELKDTKESYLVPNPRNDTFRKEVYEEGVNVEIRNTTFMDAVLNAIVMMPLIIFLIVIMINAITQLCKMGDSYFSSVKVDSDSNLKDIAGLDSIVDDVNFMIESLRNPKAFKDNGIAVPKGVLLTGPPGVGKTLIAKAIAGSADVPFISCCGSDFIEMYVGLGAKRVRSLFNMARTNAPCVIFIDEVDAIGRKRNAFGANSESNSTLDALLKEMDGLKNNNGVFVIAATNFEDCLDDAFKRPGRFDRTIHIMPPNNLKDRMSIIDLHLSNKKIGEDFDKEFLAEITKGMTGAEIANIINNAAVESIMDNREGVINRRDVELALDKHHLKGNPKENTCESEKRTIAIHEAGHAVMSLLAGKKVLKVTTIGTTSGVGGYSLSVEDGEKSIFTSKEIRERVKICYGGYVAEKLMLGDTSNGSANDIQVATHLIRDMVCMKGMDEVYVNMQELDPKFVSNKCVELAKQIVEETEKDLKQNEKLLEKIANDLLKETTIYNLNERYMV